MGKATGNPRGRPKGAPNKASAAREAEIKSSGLTPLDFMLGILRDTDADQAQRFEAAKHAAPYVHPKLNSVAMQASINARVVDISDNDLADIALGGGAGAAEEAGSPH